MEIVFLYRLKKYGTWNEGKMTATKDSAEGLQKQVEFYLKEIYPTATRIEIQSIRKK